MAVNDAKAGLGLEIDGSYLGVVAVDEADNPIGMRVEPANNLDRDPVDCLAQARELAMTVIDECESAGMTVVGAGLSVPGLVNSRTGVVLLSPNLGWEEVYPAQLLGLGELPVVIGNDAKLAALAELQVAPERNFFYLMIGAGIGGAVVTDRRLYRGQHGWDCEIGHMCVDPEGPLCACGSRGCLEQYAAKPAVFATAGLDETAPVSDLRELLEADDYQAHQALDQAATALGIALGNVINLLDVRTVIANGELVPLMPWVQQRFAQRVHTRVLAGFSEQLTLRVARTGPYPSLIGAAQLALRGY